jgi:hypothetical protein
MDSAFEDFSNTAGEDEWDALYPVLVYQGTLLVRDPLARLKYVRFVDRNWTESGKIDGLIRSVKIRS